MNPENKQRIVGIIVLIALIALLIPFLFTSGVKKNTQLATDATNESIPVQVEQQQPEALPNLPVVPESTANIDKKLPEELQQQPSSVTQQLPEKQLEKQSDVSANDQILPKDAGLPLVAAVAEENTATPIATVTKEESEQPTVMQPVTLEEPPKAENVVKDKSTVAIKTKKSAKGKGAAKFWSVQIGSFSDQARAQKIVATLQSKGYRVYLQKIATTRGAMVRVLVGHEVNKAKATKIAQQLKNKLKINGRVIGNKK